MSATEREGKLEPCPFRGTDYIDKLGKVCVSEGRVRYRFFTRITHARFRRRA